MNWIEQVALSLLTHFNIVFRDKILKKHILSLLVVYHAEPTFLQMKISWSSTLVYLHGILMLQLRPEISVGIFCPHPHKKKGGKFTKKEVNGE